MKTLLALFLALTFAAPVAAQTIQSDRRLERNYQTADRGDARLIRVAQSDERRSRWGQGAQRQQRAERPQRQQRAERPQRQQRAERPQRQQRAERPQRQAQQNFGNNERNATANLNRRQADRGPRGGNAFGQGAGPDPNRWNRNRNEGPRGNPNWNGRDGGNVYSQGPTGRNPNRWDQNRRFNGPVGNQNWNGRRDNDGRYARGGPGRDRNWNDRNWNRRDFNNNNRYNNNRFNDRRYADRYNRYNNNNGRQFYFRGQYRPSIRVSPYYWPRGYNYNRWTIGAFLPSIFFSTQYYFNDYYNYGITPPPPGYQWVRYGPDLLLVDLYTREVVDVVYGAFYW